MQTTGNLGLKKPEGTDYVDIADLNGNMDKLDTEVVKLASPTESGRMSAADKAKLNGVAAGANNYVHPNHTGDVTSNGDGVTAIAPGVIVNADVNAAAAIDASKIGTGIVSNAEYGYLDGVTSGIQAQLNARPLLTTTPQQTTGNIAYYVRTDGNDSNNGLANTAGGAFKTITRAIALIPKLVNHTVIVFVAAGTYNEPISIQGFSGAGNITIIGSNVLADTHTITGAINSLRNNCRVEVNGFKTQATTNPIFVISCLEFYAYRCKTDAVGSIGVHVESAKAYLNECMISNKTLIAVYAHVNGEILAQGTLGTGNSTGYQASFGGRIHVSTATLSATTLTNSNEGGIVTTGVGVVNPWGDNSISQRSTVWAYRSSVLTLSSNMWNTIVMNTEDADNLGEFDTTIGAFVAKAWGWYLINVCVTLSQTPANMSVFLRVVKNGNSEYKLDTRFNTASAPTDISVIGSVLINCLPGTTIVPQLFTTLNGNVVTGVAATRIEVIRVS